MVSRNCLEIVSELVKVFRDSLCFLVSTGPETYVSRQVDEAKPLLFLDVIVSLPFLPLAGLEVGCTSPVPGPPPTVPTESLTGPLSSCLPGDYVPRESDVHPPWPSQAHPPGQGVTPLWLTYPNPRSTPVTPVM